MKKILSIVMAMALLVSCLVFTSSAVANVTATVATVHSNIVLGETVRVPIILSDYANAYATVDIDNVEYDDTLLNFDGFETPKSNFEGAFSSCNETFSLVTLPSSVADAEKYDGGEVCVLVFTAKTSISVATEISASVVVQGYTNGEADNWVNFQPLTVDLVKGGLDPEVEFNGDAIATVAKVQGPIYAGDEIEIPVTITEWPNAYAAISVSMPTYDSTLLTFDEFGTSTTGFGGATGGATVNGFILEAFPTTNREANKVKGGEICVMYFYAATDINEDTTVSVVVEAKGYTFGAEDEWDASDDIVVKSVAGGVTMDILHTCVPSGEAQFNETHHWFACEVEGCTQKIDRAPHGGGEATCSAKAECSVCGVEYGDIDADNHKNTEIRNDVAANCTNEGYTGDKYCADCDELLEEGKTVPVNGNHIGGEATCIAKAKCEICGEEHGEINEDNHKNTVVRNASDTYTGDTWCLDCGIIIEEGEEIVDANPINVTATIGTVSGRFRTGDRIRIPVTMSQYDNAYGTIKVNNIVYDTTLIKLVDVEASETDFGGAFTDYNNGVFAMIAVPSDAEGAAKVDGGELCVLVFEAIANVDADVEVTANVTGRGYTNGATDQWTAHKDLSVTVVSGGIEKAKVSYGDVDDDGDVDDKDAELVAQYYGKLNVEINLNHADVDGNGKVNVRDSMLIQQYYAEIIDYFPVEL